MYVNSQEELEAAFFSDELTVKTALLMDENIMQIDYEKKGEILKPNRKTNIIQAA